jgi:ParB-like chromosome segregation protein Spo0J
VNLRELAPATLDLTLARLRQIPEAAVREKMASLSHKGQLSPLVAAEQDGALILVDGFVRQAAAVRLALPTVRVEVVHLSAPQMKAQVLVRNRERGLLLLEECRLVRELAELDGLAQVEIAELLERHKSWVCRRLALYRSLSPRLLTAPDLSFLTGGSLRRLAQLPVRNQEELVAVAQRDGLAPADLGKLVQVWQQARDPAARHFVLDQPRQAIAQARSPQTEDRDPRLTEPAEQLQRGLLILRQVSLRLQRRIQDGVGVLPPEGLQVLVRTANDAESDCRAALSAVRQALSMQ